MYRLATLSRVSSTLRPSIKTVPKIARQSLLRSSVAPFHTTRTRFAAPETNDGFLQGNSANYIEEMYEAWLKEPSSVHLSWQVYFKNMANGVSPSQAYTPPPTLVPSASARLPVLPGDGLAAAAGSSEVIDHMKIQLLSRAYQVRGHHIANLDPLGIQHADLNSSTPPELEYTYYGFKDSDLDRTFTIGPGILPAFTKTGATLTLREIIDHLKKIYCKYIDIRRLLLRDGTEKEKKI
jgi:2-oxoglutarate dehydrogenase E1 component